MAKIVNTRKLVLVGIRRKGEKGFKKSFDPKWKPENESLTSESLDIPLHKMTNSEKILNLLPE